MTRKELKNLSDEQLVKVMHKNNHVYEVARDYCENDGMYHMEEMLSGVPKSATYQIASYCQGEHFRLVRDRFNLNESILEECKEWLENNDCMFNSLMCEFECKTDEEEDSFWKRFNQCIRYQRVIDEERYSINVKDSDYNFMWNYINEFIDELDRNIYKAILSEYEYCTSDEYLEMFITDECGREMLDGLYIEDGILKEHIDYIRDYGVAM